MDPPSSAAAAPPERSSRVSFPCSITAPLGRLDANALADQPPPAHDLADLRPSDSDAAATWTSRRGVDVSGTWRRAGGDWRRAGGDWTALDEEGVDIAGFDTAESGEEVGRDAGKTEFRLLTTVPGVPVNSKGDARECGATGENRGGADAGSGWLIPPEVSAVGEAC